MNYVTHTRRPVRADARRNFDSLVVTARDAFTELGTDAPLEEIARRAGVGIATLYRNFPTRGDLVEAVYLEEVEAVCAAADELAGREPLDALMAWLQRFVAYAGTKKVLIDALNRESPALQACRGVLSAAGGPLLKRAQAAGMVRDDASIDDVMRLVTGIAGVSYVSADQRQRVMTMALDGLRTPLALAQVS